MSGNSWNIYELITYFRSNSIYEERLSIIYKKFRKIREDKKNKQLSKNLPHNHPWSRYYPKKYTYQLKDAEMPIYHWLDQVLIFVLS